MEKKTRFVDHQPASLSQPNFDVDAVWSGPAVDVVARYIFSCANIDEVLEYWHRIVNGEFENASSLQALGVGRYVAGLLKAKKFYQGLA